MDNGSQAEATTCRYCAAVLRAGSTYCTECKRFQSFTGRLLTDLTLSSLVALIPIATLAFAYLNETVIVPYSRLTATVSRCSGEQAVVALSNTGTRTAIVEGGIATFVPTAPAFDRYLAPPGTGLDPVVVKAGEALVRRFAFADGRTLEATPAPVLTDRACHYDIALSVLEFGGRRTEVPAGRCTC